jgi:hypothetical protein
LELAQLTEEQCSTRNRPYTKKELEKLQNPEGAKKSNNELQQTIAFSRSAASQG